MCMSVPWQICAWPADHSLTSCIGWAPCLHTCDHNHDSSCAVRISCAANQWITLGNTYTKAMQASGSHWIITFAGAEGLVKIFMLPQRNKISPRKEYSSFQQELDAFLWRIDHKKLWLCVYLVILALAQLITAWFELSNEQAWLFSTWIFNFHGRCDTWWHGSWTWALSTSCFLRRPLQLLSRFSTSWMRFC